MSRQQMGPLWQPNAPNITMHYIYPHVGIAPFSLVCSIYLVAVKLLNTSIYLFLHLNPVIQGLLPINDRIKSIKLSTIMPWVPTKNKCNRFEINFWWFVMMLPGYFNLGIFWHLSKENIWMFLAILEEGHVCRSLPPVP